RGWGDVGGTWPGAGVDVAAAVHYVPELTGRYPLDPARVALVGHSAGGQLALWAAKRAQLPVVALAPVSDLRESAERVGAPGAAPMFMGGLPDEASHHYAEAAPIDVLPFGAPQIPPHGTKQPD